MKHSLHHCPKRLQYPQERSPCPIATWSGLAFEKLPTVSSTKRLRSPPTWLSAWVEVGNGTVCHRARIEREGALPWGDFLGERGQGGKEEPSAPPADPGQRDECSTDGCFTRRASRLG
ncbi:unnamed protein product [Ectocarpus sp. 4 AP-2014]